MPQTAQRRCGGRNALRSEGKGFRQQEACGGFFWGGGADKCFGERSFCLLVLIGSRSTGACASEENATESKGPGCS